MNYLYSGMVYILQHSATAPVGWQCWSKVLRFLCVQLIECLAALNNWHCVFERDQFSFLICCPVDEVLYFVRYSFVVRRQKVSDLSFFNKNKNSRNLQALDGEGGSR